MGFLNYLCTHGSRNIETSTTDQLRCYNHIKAQHKAAKGHLIKKMEPQGQKDDIRLWLTPLPLQKQKQKEFDSYPILIKPNIKSPDG